MSCKVKEEVTIKIEDPRLMKDQHGEIIGDNFPAFLSIYHDEVLGKVEQFASKNYVTVDKVKYSISGYDPTSSVMRVRLSCKKDAQYMGSLKEVLRGCLKHFSNQGEEFSDKDEHGVSKEDYIRELELIHGDDEDPYPLGWEDDYGSYMNWLDGKDDIEVDLDKLLFIP